MAHPRRAPARAILEVVGSFLVGLARRQVALAAENAFLHAQLLILREKVPRPHLDPAERGLLATLAGLVPRWRELLVVAAPDTLIRWHREGWRAFWRWKSRPRKPGPGKRTPAEIRKLIREVALENPRWGSKRIVGELWAKLRISVHKRTVQRVLKAIKPERRRRRRAGQTWATFVRNHLPYIWGCDFFTVPTAWLGELYVFFVLKAGTREIVHWNVTRHPTEEWTAAQLRAALEKGEAPPKYVVRDRDKKYGTAFDAVAKAAGARVCKSPTGGPQGNAYAERWVGSARRECLDHFIVLGEEHLRALLSEWMRHYHEARAHQGLGQRIPAEVERHVERERGWRVVRRPILGGLITEHSAAA